jgi:hypothetical protein
MEAVMGASPEQLFISRSREKLLNAIIYFVENTERCHTLKLFKLLNFLDFEHFRQTGYSVTGLEYKAWPQGPAPAALWRELANPKPDLKRVVSVTWVNDDLTGAPKRREIKPRAKFDPQHFTKRELKIMETLAFFFKEAKGEDMTEVSHARDLPWGKVFAGGKGNGLVIPYDLAVKSTPIIPGMPSLPEEEINRRHEAFKEIDGATAR